MDSGPTTSEQTEATAAAWFAKHESGSWTDLDQAAFNAWLEAETANRIAYIRLETAWKHSARLKALGAGVPPGVIPERGSWGDTRFFRGQSPQIRPPRSSSLSLSGETDELPSARERRGSRSRARLFSAAAILLTALSAGIYVYVAAPFAGDRYATPVGGLNNVRLVDGSHVTLNTDTSIRTILTAKERRIDLNRGEAFFEVAEDPSRPFVVYAGTKRVMAMGTKFSVRREADDVQVVVTEGKVKLATAASSLAAPEEKKATGDSGKGEGSASLESAPAPTLLYAGAVAKTSATEVLVREAAEPDTERLLSWRTGYVNFRDTTLRDAVAEFNRYNVRKIVIADPAVGSIRIGGNFRSNNTAAFLALIQSGFPVAVEQSDDTVILKAR